MRRRSSGPGQHIISGVIRIDELFADSVIRHEVGEAHTLTREQAVKRVEDTWALFDKLRFELNIVIAGLTLVFLLAVVTLQPFAIFSVKSSGTGEAPS